MLEASLGYLRCYHQPTTPAKGKKPFLSHHVAPVTVSLPAPCLPQASGKARGNRTLYHRSHGVKEPVSRCTSTPGPAASGWRGLCGLQQPALTVPAAVLTCHGLGEKSRTRLARPPFLPQNSIVLSSRAIQAAERPHRADGRRVGHGAAQGSPQDRGALLSWASDWLSPT